MREDLQQCYKICLKRIKNAMELVWSNETLLVLRLICNNNYEMFHEFLNWEVKYY